MLCCPHSHQGAVYLQYTVSLIPYSAECCHTERKVVPDPRAWHSAYKSSK